MLTSPAGHGQARTPHEATRPLRQGKTATPAEAAALIGSGSTLAVGWIGDALASAIAQSFRTGWQPRDLTVLYGAIQGVDRVHGLNRLAIPGLVQRVIGGQWYPVPALQAMAASDRIEAYSIPAGLINHLLRAIAAGLPSHITRIGLGTLADPRHGGGRLNRRTQKPIVHLVDAGGEPALMVEAMPIDVGLVGVSFLAETGTMLMTRGQLTVANAARRSGGLVIAQAERVGTQSRRHAEQVEVADDLIDVLVTSTEPGGTVELGALPAHLPSWRPGVWPQVSLTHNEDAE